MRTVVIVGASQAGLHLAHGLLDHGYEVTLITTPASPEMRNFAPPLVGFTLPSALDQEFLRGLNFWDDAAPRVAGVHMSFRPEPSQRVEFTGHFPTPATVIDSRIKRADLLEYFEDRGGRVVIQGITPGDLDYFTRMFALVVVAVGGGELGALFQPDHTRLAGATRVVTQAFLQHDEDDEHASTSEVRVVSAPFGEVFETPVLTQDGMARAVFLASAPDGALDCFSQDRTPAPDYALQVMRERLGQHAPDVAERLRGAQLLPGRSVTTRRVTPVVRDPVGVLPNGGVVLGIGDVLCRSDPITGREISDETLAAETYLEAIREYSDLRFDEAALRSIFERYYDAHGRVAADFTRIVRQWWEQAPAPHVMALLGAAQTHQEVADHYVAGFNNPAIYTDLLGNPTKAYALLENVGAIPAS